MNLKALFNSLVLLEIQRAELGIYGSPRPRKVAFLEMLRARQQPASSRALLRARGPAGPRGFQPCAGPALPASLLACLVRPEEPHSDHPLAQPSGHVWTQVKAGDTKH